MKEITTPMNLTDSEIKIIGEIRYKKVHSHRTGWMVIMLMALSFILMIGLARLNQSYAYFGFVPIVGVLLLIARFSQNAEKAGRKLLKDIKG